MIGKWETKVAHGLCMVWTGMIMGFSLEEHTVPKYCWSGNLERDPWEWREIIARRGKIAYGKFFDKRAGFGKEGEKGFDGVITTLQMQTYLCLRDFRQRKNKKGEVVGKVFSDGKKLK